MAVTSFFNSFPKIKYDINNSTTFQSGSHENVTNIFFRLGIIQNALNNISSYIVYDIEDGETPELLAERFYGDAGANWVILLANNIVDPQFEWPLDYTSFQQYIVDRYGSSEIAQTTTHHFEKVITRRNTRTDVSNETRFWINGTRLTDEMLPDVPYSYYYPWSSTTHRTADSLDYRADNSTIDLLADLDNAEAFGASLDRGNLATTGDYIGAQTYQIGDDSIEVTIRGEEVTCYEYESRLNDDRRSIKVIKADYYMQIMDEFRFLTGQKPDYIRKLF